MVTPSKDVGDEAPMTWTYQQQPEYGDSAISMKIICQVSMAGIDLYANVVVNQLTKNFKLSLRGQRNLNSALVNLPLYRTPDPKLSFGWCVDHALKNYGVHEHVYEHLALEVALGEIFPERFAAKILWELGKLYGTKYDLTPHFRDTIKLVNSSNGIFTSSDFGLLTESYLRKLPDSGSGAAADQPTPSPNKIAQAILMFGKLTKEADKQMTVVGGRLLAWFAATAEWLYDLPSVICLASGERIHASHEGQKTRILMIYSPEPRLEAKFASWTDDASQAISTATGLISLKDHEVIPNVRFGGRVVWNSLLSQVFGQSFHYLDHEHTKTLGTAIGAVARALIDSKERHGSVHSNNLSRPVGAALIKLLSDWLPELRHLQSRMERQLKLSIEESRKVYVESIEKLQKACGCGICATDGTVERHAEIPPPYGYCLTTLVETILVLGMSLSRLTVSSQIYPTAQGIRNLYRQQLAKRIEALEVKYKNQLEVADHVFSDRWDLSDVKRMQNCAELFSGSKPTVDLPDNLVALSHEGICVYLVGLEKKRNTSGGDDQDLLLVTSGGVCVQYKVFSRAAVGPVAGADEFNDFWEEVPISFLSKPLYCR